ncbi:FIST N-terminal domain-containing protein [Clostridium sp. C2-6-12]|uniref:FIST signal transduction protein n=1 Tax=Clostridium sp. C2-6-12 TaxID=2698832 RepID=UPI00325FC247
MEKRVIVLGGQIKRIIDNIIEERANGNPAIKEMTIAKLILKGINPNKFDEDSPDDVIIIEKLLNIAKQLNVKSFDKEELNIKSAFSTKFLEEEAVAEIKSQLNISNIKLVVFFSSNAYDQYKLSKLMKEAFADCVVVGCSTAGELVSGKLLKNSVVAMAINSNIIADVKLEVIENMNKTLNLDDTFASFENYYGESLYTMDSGKFVGVSLIDGISMKEEKIMDLIGDRTNIFFVGGSAGDDHKFLKTYIFAEGIAYTNSAALLILKINDNAEFDIIKTQSFTPLNHVFIANKVDEEKREVIEFNNRPAVYEYAQAVGATSISEVSKYFSTNPLGLTVGEDNMFIRTPQRTKDTSMLFYCNILEGMEVRLLKSTNIIEDTKKAIGNKITEMGRIDGIINFDCVERILELERKHLEEEYGEIFNNIPTIGFSTYGEQFIGHMNQTSAMLVFKTK